MEQSSCRNCSAKSLPDVVEPCRSCQSKSNWNANRKDQIFAQRLMKAPGKRTPKTKVISNNPGKKSID